MALDERLRDELERAARPADPSGIYERLIERRERRRLARRFKAGALTVAVALGCVVGIVVLSRVFARTPVEPAAGGGQGIVFGDGPGEETDLFVVRPDGTGLRRLTHDGGSGAARWSPDGTKIVFARYDERTQTSDLFVMDADGSEITRLSDTPELSESSSSWSPDGSRIAFEAHPAGARPSQIYVMNADGGNVVRLSYTAGDAASPDWSPDGSQLVFHLSPPPSPDGPAGSAIWVMDADGGNARRIVGDGASGNYEPRWSPDGDAIVFTHDRDVYIVRPDGTGLKNLTPEEGTDVYDRDPAWSSDGERIVFASGRGFESALTLFTMDPDGSDVRPVLDFAIGFCCPRPDWHGDTVDTATPEPSRTDEPSATDEPSPTDEPAPDELGLGFPVCNVSSIEGRFTSADIDSTVFVATRMGDMGGCPQADDAFNVISLDTDGDRMADTSLGPIECTYDCRTFSAPDVDGDGTDELLVVQDGGAVVGLRLYDFISSNDAVEIQPVNVAEPGDPRGGFEPGEQASFLFGGDAFELYTLRCGNIAERGGPGLIATAAESLPHDSVNAQWHAHEVTLYLGDEGELGVVEVRDFTEPVIGDPAGPSFQSGETLCGANLGP